MHLNRHIQKEGAQFASGVPDNDDQYEADHSNAAVAVAIAAKASAEAAEQKDDEEDGE